MRPSLQLMNGGGYSGCVDVEAPCCAERIPDVAADTDAGNDLRDILSASSFDIHVAGLDRRYHLRASVVANRVFLHAGNENRHKIVVLLLAEDCMASRVCRLGK